MTPPVILGIAGSPRRRGNSERLLDACLEGVTAAGGAVDKLVVVESDVAPCNGCDSCVTTGECVLTDGMTAVYPRLDSADAIVVASPVFFATVPAVLKALYDRCQPYWARRWVMGEPAPARKRPGAILLARAGGDPFGFEAAVTPTESVFAVLGVRTTGKLEVAGVDEPGDISRHADALERAREIGSKVVREAAGTGV